MKLVLSVQNSAVALANGVAPTCEFSTKGGTIGREGNAWILRGDANPDNDLVSRQHATISYLNGGFSVVDSSTNGTQLNGRTLHRGDMHPLQEGDVLFIEPYRIAVSLSFEIATATAAYSPPPPSAHVPPAAKFVEIPAGLPGTDVPPHTNPLIHPQGKPQPPRPIPPANPLNTPFTTQQPARPNLQDGDPFKQDGDPFKEESPAPDPSADEDPFKKGPDTVPLPLPLRPPAQSSQPTPAPNPDDPLLMKNLLAGAGLEGVALSPEVAAQLGQILRIMVEGLLEVLQARAEIKQQFRLPGTTFQQEGNNPLKKSIDVEEAMHDLFVKRHPRFLAAPAAFEDAFLDVRHHQLAFLAGVNAAYDAMLKRFSPDELRTQFDKKPGHKPKLALGAGGRHWEAYEHHYQELTADREDCFRRMFGEDFGRTYEEKLQALRNLKRRPGPRK